MVNGCDSYPPFSRLGEAEVMLMISRCVCKQCGSGCLYVVFLIAPHWRVFACSWHFGFSLGFVYLSYSRSVRYLVVPLLQKRLLRSIY